MKSSALHVLIVDDSPEDRYSLRRHLAQAAPDLYRVTEASGGEQALAACATTAPDCILLDYQLPDWDGLDVLAALRARSDVPVVVLTGVGNEALAVEALKRGAQDYLVKGGLTPERLSLTLRNAVEAVRVARERDQTTALLASVLVSLPVGVAILDADLGIRQLNPALTTILGQPAAAPPGQALPRRWPALAEELAAPCAEVLRGAPFSDLELRLPAGAAAAERWLSFSGTPLDGADGAERRILLTVQDITARRQAEAERLASEARFRAIIELGTEGVALLETDGQIRYGSPGLAALLGYPQASMTALRLGDLCHPDDQPQLAAFLATLTAHPRASAQVTTRLRHQDGAWRWVAQQGCNQADFPALAAPIVSFHDVTERVQAEQVLQHATRRLQILAAASQAFAEVAVNEPALLGQLARLAGEPLAASCIIWRSSEDSRLLHAGAVYSRDPAVQALLSAAYADTPLPIDAPLPVAAVARSGQPLLMPVVDPELLRRALGPEQWSALERVRPHSAVIVPLRAHGATLGGLVLTRHEPGQPAFTADDLTLAEELAGRAALALTNARLYQEAMAARQTATEALARLDALIRSVPSGIGYLDRELRYQLVNPALAAINQRTPEEHLGLTPHAILPGLAPRLEPLMRQVLETGEAVRDLELHGQLCAALDGAHDWLISYFPVRGPDGAVSGVGVTITDVTASKRTATALHRSEQMLRLFVTHAPAAIAMFDRSMCYLAASDRYLADYRLAEQSLVGRSHYEIFPELPERMRAIHQRCLAGASAQGDDAPFPRADGTLDWVRWEIHPWHEPGGEVGGLILFSEVITAHKQAEEALRASETRYRTLFETMAQGVIYFASDGQIVAANPAAERILGLSLDEIQGRTALDPRWRTVHEDGTPFPIEEHPAMLALRTGQAVRDVVMGVYHPHLETFRWITVQAVPHMQAGATGWAQGYVLFEDITERRQATRALELERRQLAAILNTMHNGVIAARPDGSFAIINPAALALIDLDPTHRPASLAETEQLNSYEIITLEGQVLPPEHWPLLRVLRGERFAEQELGLRSTQHGGVRWSSFNGTPVFDQDGALILGVVTSQDITAHKADEAALRAAHAQAQAHAARLDSLLANAPVGISLLDTELRYQAINAHLAALNGLPPEAHLGRTISELLPAIAPLVEPSYARVLATGEPLIDIQIVGATPAEPGVPRIWTGTFFPVRTADHTLLGVGAIIIDITTQRGLERALQTEHRQLAAILENLDEGVMALQPDGTLVTMNSAVRRHLGWPADAAPPTLAAFQALFRHVFYDHDGRRLPREEHPTERALRGQAFQDVQLRLVREHDGQERWYTFTGAPVHDAEGALELLVVMARDITAERQADLVLRENRQNLQVLIDNTDGAIWSVDREFRVVVGNTAFRQLARALVGQELEAGELVMQETLPAALLSMMSEYGARTLAGEHLSGVVAVPVGGEERSFEYRVSPMRTAAGAIIGATTFARDITEQQWAEQALRDTERKLGTLFALLPVGVSIIDATGALAYTNPAMERIMRMDQAGMGARAYTQRPHVRPDGTPLPATDFAGARALREQQPVIDVEAGFTTAAGERVWVSSSALPVDFPDWRIVVVMSDITTRIEAELALRANAATLARTNAELTRALRLKDEFLAMMSHELRTPLNAVLGVTEAMEEGLYGPIVDRQRQALGTVTQSARHLLAILSDILDLTFIEAGRAMLDLDAVDVDRLCRTALQFVQASAQAKGVHLFRTVAGEVEGLRADERRLTQILTNLLTNAVKFTPAGGRAGLEVAVDETQERIAFTVWDTGIGIAPEDMGRLFQPFTQVDGRLSRAYEGIGLGLTLVRRLAELHGGSVSLESTVGQGSRFTVRLPWSQGENVAPAAPRGPTLTPSAWARPPRLVIADDHEITLQFYTEVLGQQGCQLALARTGVEAVAQVRATRPDVAIIDVQMPELDGLSAIRQIRADAEVGATPIIALTAQAMPGDRERCLEAGASAYLAKPVGLRTLMAAIAEVLAGSAAGQGSA